jgi:selenocysteine lyase/cysteine desulfurase
MLSPSRKEFLKITGTVAGGFLFNPSIANSFKREGERGEFSLEKNIIFLNNGTVGPSPKSVSDAVKDRIDKVNEKAIYGGLEAETLSKVASFLNVKSEDLALTHNVTEGINIAAWGLMLEKGDEVLMTGHEHVGGALPWLNRQKIDGIKVRTFGLRSTAVKTLEAIEEAVTSKTKVIAVPHIPCTTGQVLPVKEIASFAKSKGIITVIDGAHPTGMMPLDITDIGCDIYASCFHKWLCGPKGTGYIYVSERVRDQLKPIFIGAHGADWLLKENEMKIMDYSDSAHQYFYGTQNSSLYAGIIAAIDFQNKIGRQKIFEHGKTLANYFKDFVLTNRFKYELLTPQEDISSANIISFKHSERGLMLYKHLKSKNIITRYVAESDLFCNRISFHIYNTKKDVDILIEEIKKLG